MKQKTLNILRKANPNSIVHSMKGVEITAKGMIQLIEKDAEMGKYFVQNFPEWATNICELGYENIFQPSMEW